MSAAFETFHTLILETRKRNTKRVRFAELMTVIFALLVWRTTWLPLRPGLAILLVGQLAIVCVLLYRNMRLTQNSKQASASFNKAGVLTWFEQEETFNRRLSLIENGTRIIGLAVLAYGFWQMTRNVWIAAAIGVLYPASSYFGMTRASSASASRYLQKRKEEITWKL